MAKQFVKVSSGLKDVTKPKIKTYENYAKFQEALANGDLKEGEYFSIVAAGGIHDDITTLVYQMWDNTPANASIDNKYVVWSDLDDLDLTQAIQRIEAIENDLPNLKSDIVNVEDNLEAYKTSNDNAVSVLDSDKVNCSDYNTKMTCLDRDISDINTNKASCSDLTNLTTRVSTNESDISNLKSCAGLNCVGNVTISALETCLNNYVTNTTLASCGYTTCTGTVVASDIANFVSETCINSKISSATSNKVNCSDYSSCIAALVARIAALESCAGLNCVGNVTASDFTLTGNDLAICM